MDEQLLRNLPEDLAREIVWRTSPVDAARLAVISKWLKSVAESDVVWDKFVPSDWAEMVSKSMVYATKKELCISLCRTPIFPDDGKLGFFVDKRSGKKCYIVVARELMFPWDDFSRQSWSRLDSSSTEVAVLNSLNEMDIRGKINVRILSPNSIYGAYLVYKLPNDCFHSGFRSLNTVVRVVEHESESEAETRAAVVHLIPRSSRFPRSTQSVNANFPVTRDDGWLEILMGTFYNHPRYHGDQVEARLMEVRRIGRGYGDLIVKAIYFRPL